MRQCNRPRPSAKNRRDEPGIKTPILFSLIQVIQMNAPKADQHHRRRRNSRGNSESSAKTRRPNSARRRPSHAKKRQRGNPKPVRRRQIVRTAAVFCPNRARRQRYARKILPASAKPAVATVDKPDSPPKSICFSVKFSLIDFVLLKRMAQFKQKQQILLFEVSWTFD